MSAAIYEVQSFSIDDLNRPYKRFLSEIENNRFISAIDIEVIQREKKSVSLFFEPVEDCLILAIENILFNHGNIFYSYNYQDIISCEDKNIDGGVKFGSYSAKSDKFSDMFADMTFSSERVISSEDSEIVMLCDFSDYMLLIMPRDETDEFLRSFVPTPLEALRNSMRDGDIPENDHAWLEAFLEKLKPVLV